MTKKILHFLIAISILFNLTITSASASTQSIPQPLSQQSKTLIAEAKDKGLIPIGSSTQYKSNITRQDFSLLVANLLERYKQMTLEQYCESIGANNYWYFEGSFSTGGKAGPNKTNYPYTDTENYTIFNLYSTGMFKNIVAGKGFKPNEAISREEAAALIYNAAKLTDKKTYQNGTYADVSAVSAFAKEGVNFVVSNNIIKTENNKYLPKSKLTYEQAYITILNFYRYLSPDIKSAAFAIAPIYDSANEFSEGLALVSKGNTYFYIDKTGKEVIKLPYDKKICNAYDFKNGLAVIELPYQNIIIAINKLGKEVFRINNIEIRKQPDFRRGYIEYITTSDELLVVDTKGKIYEDGYLSNCIDGFTDGMSIFGYSNNQYGVKDQNGKVIIGPNYEHYDIQFLGDGYISLGKGDDWGIFDKTGKEVVKPGQYSLIEISKESILVNEGQNYKLITKSGAVLFETDKPFEFKENVAFVQKNGVNAIIDRLGNIMYQINSDDYHFAGFSDGLAAVINGSNWIVIDKEFKESDTLGSESAYAYIEEFKEGLAAVCTWKNKWGVIDKSGNIIVEPKYKWIENYIHGLAVFAGEDSKVGCIDKDGKVVMEPIYDEIEIGDGIVVVKKGSMKGLYDSSGKEIVKLQSEAIDIAYEMIGNKVVRYDAFAFCYENDESYYYIGKAGDKLYDISPGGEGFFIVEYRTQANPQGTYTCEIGYVDTHGNKVIPSRYKSAFEFDEEIPGLAKVYIGHGKHNADKIGFIDKKGNAVIPIEYDVIGSFANGIAPATKGYKYGYIDDKGNVIVSFIYDDAGSFVDGLAYVCKNGRYGYITMPNK